MRVSAVTDPVHEVDVDLLVVFVASDDNAARGTLRHVDRALGGQVSEAMQRGELTAARGEVIVWPAPGLASRRVMAVGVGDRKGVDADAIRRAAGVAARRAMPAYESVALVLRSDTHAEAAVEGFVLGAYEPDLYRAKRKPNRVEQLRVVGAGDVRRAADAGRILGESTNLARDLVTEPPNELTPTRLGERAEELLGAVGVQVDVLTGADLEPFGALRAVAKGSDEPPVLITAAWEPARARRSPVLGLVGKGVTFDSGGLSLKTNDGMQWMKGDMAGAAATIGAMHAIASMKLGLRVKAAIPATENMPSGKATRVGDVIRSYAGKTIEVLNTDAEGRLILADALAWIAEQGVTQVVDAATLTGAVEIALGKVACGVMGRPDRWVDRVVSASRRAGERAWPLPLYPEYREQLRSEVADLKNIGGRPAGTITAAWFLAEFVPEDLAWAHLDIAGVAWHDGSAHLAKGATGSGVRAFVRVAQDLAGRT